MRVIIVEDDEWVGIGSISRPSGCGVKGHVARDESAFTQLDNIEYFQPFINLGAAEAPPLRQSPFPVPSATVKGKAAALERINTTYQDAITRIMAGYPENEIISWPKQEAEARAWLSNANASTPWIDAASASRGITKVDLVDKIMAHVALFYPLHGEFTGKRQKLRDRIAALGESPAQQQLDAIQW
jgi:hypothetical protein